jgi:hypothetical protein
MAYVDLTLLQFQKRFCDEESCLQAILEARWPRGFVCPRCGHHGGNRITTRRAIQCCACRRQVSITSNTLFHKSRTPLVMWFLIIYFVAHDKGGASALRLSKQLGMHYTTVWFIVQKIRIAMACREENLTLAGYIEMDEAFFGGRNRSKGKPKPKGKRKPPSYNKRQVLVLVESEGRQAGNLVLKVIPDDRYVDIKPVIEAKVESEPGGQWFRADGWGSHHVVVGLGHKLEMGPIPTKLLDRELRCVSLAVSHAKEFLKGTFHHFCKTHIQRYLDEFCYRWNRRHLETQLASHLIVACALHYGVPYDAIPAPKQPGDTLPAAA